MRYRHDAGELVVGIRLSFMLSPLHSHEQSQLTALQQQPVSNAVKDMTFPDFDHMHATGCCRREPHGLWPGSTSLIVRSTTTSAHSAWQQAVPYLNLCCRRAHLSADVLRW